MKTIKICNNCFKSTHVLIPEWVNVSTNEVVTFYGDGSESMCDNCNKSDILTTLRVDQECICTHDCVITDSIKGQVYRFIRHVEGRTTKYNVVTINGCTIDEGTFNKFFKTYD